MLVSTSTISTSAVPTLYLSHEFIFYFEGSFFIYFCITVPLYIFLICILVRAQLIKTPDLSTPFFQICIASSIIDLVTLLNNYFGAVFPKWGLWPSLYYGMGQPFVKTYFYIAWATGICQAISVSIMATNRLYAMVHPESYAKFWQGWRLKLAIATQFVIGMTLSLANFFTDTEMAVTDNGTGLIPRISNKDVSKLYFTIGGFFLGINSLYLIIAYAYLLKVVRSRLRHQISVEARADRTRAEAKRREQRLFLMSTCVVAVQLSILCFFTTFIFPIVKITTEQFYMFYSALSDFYSGVNPYLLLAFSDALRTHIKNLFFCKKPDTIVHSVISTRNTRSHVVPE